MAAQAQALPANRLVPPIVIVSKLVDGYECMRDSNLFFNLIAKVLAFVIAFIPVLSWYFSAEIATRDTEKAVLAQLPAPAAELKQPGQGLQDALDKVNQQMLQQKLGYEAAATQVSSKVTDLTVKWAQATKELSEAQATNNGLIAELTAEQGKVTDLNGRLSAIISHASPAPDRPAPAKKTDEKTNAT